MAILNSLQDGQNAVCYKKRRETLAVKFTKMQGLGNDYIYVNCFEETVDNPAELVVRLSDRHFGVGSDGLILICPTPNGDAMMDLYNADGSRAMMCGNGIRCVGKYVYEKGIASKDVLKIDTLSGVKTLHLSVKDGAVYSVGVDMGAPEFQPEKIPVSGQEGPVIQKNLSLQGQDITMTCVSMGNPHCVLFVEDTKTAPVHTLGPVLEHSELFPAGVNVEFIRVINEKELEMRVWERGSGETMACGTGACAAVVAAIASGKTERTVTVHLLGGDLSISWPEDSSNVFMEGPAEFVFEGSVEL